jgi:hypothetical protein
MARKTNKAEPTLRDEIAAAFDEALRADFVENGASVLQEMRKNDPTRYAELVARRIVAAEPKQEATGFSQASTMKEVGARLLQSIGIVEPTAEQIQEAIAANTEFIAQLESIKARAEGGLN